MAKVLRQPHFVITALLVIACAAALAGARRNQSREFGGDSSARLPHTATASELALRSAALNTPLPAYPASAEAQFISGVAVAEVTVRIDGNVERVRVLEAPDASMAAAVRTAVAQWKFAPMFLDEGGKKVPVRLQSRLTFYFCLVDGKGVVLNPDQMQHGRGLHTLVRSRAG